ncbi:MAG: BMP family ABC transporter substrate-binding protein [Clostridia bacterium]
MKKVLLVLLATLIVFSSVACGAEKPEAEPKAGESKPVKVGIVLTTAGLGDKNFNDMSYAGLLKAQEDFGIKFDYVEPKAVSDYVSQHRMFAESEDYDLIIGLAADQIEAIKEVIKDFPDQKISLIDANADLPNVSSVFTKWQEQTFLCGVIAGLGTKSNLEKANAENVVGVVLGQDFPTLRQGVVGFEAGVRYVNPEAEVLKVTVGDFNDPGKAKEIALSMYNRGADFIQHIAGASGLGVFNAAKEANRYVFGVGGNQNAIEPDNIVSTSIRNVNEMVYNEVKSIIDGTWKQGVHISGLKEGAVGYSVENSNVKLTEEILSAVEDIKEKIINGELVPCDNTDQLEDWVAKNQYSK